MLNPHDLESCVICHECDLLVDIGELAPGFRAVCPRCGCTVARAHRNAIDRILVFSVTALLFLLLSNSFEFVELVVQGQERQITLLQTVRELFALDEWLLALIMLVVIVGLPATFTLLLLWLALSIRRGAVTPHSIRLLQVIGYVRFWNMAEIFFLGILVSMVKLATMASVDVGYSFWAYALFNLFLVAAMSQVDKVQLALAIRGLARVRPHSELAHGG